ncbi:COG4315 family predicted lipoprotein [Aminobacter sp. Piv2-1]|uniref:COG4315 family predicted lipoprotein n=1 Tax=Aminobacter sp. Piv2-1 TaxID=3031122 RepID=UPI0030AE394B
MKTVASTLAVLFLSTAASLAAEPAKVMDSSAGKIYTDAAGMTLYTFDKDSAGKSACNDDCAKNWPPLMAAADAKDEGEWTLVTRDDGSKMWAYEGKPLYTFAQDKKAGDVTGDGKGGVWHVAKAD